MADDKIKIICPSCRNPFREKARDIRDGFQAQCPHRYRMITFDKDSQDPNVMRALRAAREMRRALVEAEAAVTPRATVGRRPGGSSDRLPTSCRYEDPDRG